MWLKSDSQRRQWKIRHAVARAIETRNKIPDCGAPRWNETKKETVLFAFGGERPREQDAVGGARLTIEIGADFAIGPSPRRRRQPWVAYDTLLAAWPSDRGGKGATAAYVRFVEAGLTAAPASPFREAFGG